MATPAALKIKIFRLVDAQDGETLEDLYQLLLARLAEKAAWSSVEAGYAAMAADEARETAATAWIEQRD